MRREITGPAKGKVIVDHFDSVGEFVDHVTDQKNKPRAGLSIASQDKGRDEFFWTKTFDEAVGLSSTGWPAGAAKVTEHREGLDSFVRAAASAKSRQHGWDLTGDYIDIGRHMSGEPEVFGTEIDYGDTVIGKVVSIRLNTSVSSAVDASTICARGVTVLVAVDLLEAIGVRCEVIVACGAEQSGWGSAGNDPHLKHYDFNVTVKKAGEQVDPDRLAFSVAHPSFFRRLGFRCEEIAGYSPNAARPARLADYGARPGVIEIDEILSGASLSRKELQKNVLAIAEKCGIKFEQDQIDALLAATGN